MGACGSLPDIDGGIARRRHRSGRATRPRARYDKPKRFQLRGIFQRFPEDARDAERQALRREMENLEARLEAGESVDVVDLVHFLVKNGLMIRLNVHEAKTHLSRYLARLAGGELILLCKRNVPIAEIRPVRQPRTERRPVGLAKDRFEVPTSFFDPLPEDLLDAFAGKQP